MDKLKQMVVNFTKVVASFRPSPTASLVADLILTFQGFNRKINALQISSSRLIQNLILTLRHFP